jgi:predicted 3-demethylubiquinone-9 3-methyltransferase (glyoxalase superfamily)
VESDIVTPHRKSQKLSEGCTEMQCGWLQDKLGISWQIVPAVLLDFVKTPKDWEASMKTVKLNVAEIERAVMS